MSFSDDYYSAKEKRKKKKKQEAASQGSTNFEKQYYTLRAGEDIAPTRDFPIMRQTEDVAPVKKTTTKKDERKWFEKGLFEDGYQFGDITKTILGTGEDVKTNLGTGVVGMGEKVLDALATLGAVMNRGTMMEAANNEMMYNALTGKKTDGVLERYQGYQDQVEKETAAFVAKDLYDEEAVAKKIVGVSLTSHLMKKMGAEDEDSFSVLGEKSDALAQSAGQLAATAALQSVGVPWWLTTGTTTFGSEAESAFNQGSTYDEAVLSSAITAGAEILTEKISGGISFGGNALDDALTKELGRAISNKTVRTLAKLGVDMAGEGAEEVLSGVMSAIGQKMTYADEKEFNELFSSEEAFESFIGGAVLGGAGSAVNAVKSKSAGVDAVTGLTENEQKVVDKVYEAAVTEQEQGGKKLTAKEKRKIYDGVMNDFEKGYITTDTIEEALGGDTYKTYQDTIANEDALRNEFDTLNKMKQGDMTGEQIDRRTELKQQLEELKTNSQRDQLKAQLSDEVFNLAKDTRLAESYNEKARRGQAFEADIAKYDAKQQTIIQKAIDSGILNNTNRTHEFVDLIAKISADKGVSFDFTDNAKLKESGFAVDGANVNGYVNGNGDITLNINASKALNSVTGHEITHILEGTELYTELQNTIFEYAKSKGEYDSRLAALTKLYENVDGADVNAELTADLVGDYLFTDADFVRNLSTNHRNVFEKIYDEIKYLCKVATAGSKEARELEKVKKAFEDAYRADSKASGKTKYSLGYHAGDLGKAELLHQQGYSRGTGHFGTGTYFVGDEAKISGDHTYGKRPHHAVEFDNYNLYKIKNDKDGYELHEQLKVLDGGVSQEYYDRAVADEFRLYPFVNAFDLAEKKYKTPDNSWDEALVSAYQEIADMRGVEYQSAEEWGSENNTPVDYEWFADYYGEYLKQTVNEAIDKAEEDYAEFRDAYFKLWLRFGTKNTQKALRDVIAHQQAINPDGERNYARERAAEADSFATVFMKGLGYEGIDTRGTGLDNTAYGSVIYDLKGEDLAKKNAIGTAKYSLTDNTGKQLSKGQQDYFKDSKMRDDDGNLMVMYHGSQDAGFHEFNAKFSDDDTSFFFVDRNDVAASYSGTSETYEARTMHTAEDVNDFIAEIGVEGYEVVEQDGKFTLIYEGDNVATSDTAKGIYEEFCWYESVGEGDANYKVYLNLTNPLIVDGKGRPWNKIDAEFSQEVYDKYNSLTAEEKAALTDLAEWEDFRVFNSEIQEARDNELASAYAKMGEDVNIYDLFSVAADNFSEEAMRENARHYLKTRDYAQRAHEQGYDGVIFKNIVDNGGYSNGSEGASTVAIAFDSKQIKSTANVNPTENADIRYSLSDSDGNKLSNEQAEYFKDSKVRDENGNLKIMHHGSSATFTVFDKSKAKSSGTFGKGFYFTDSVSHANQYGNVYDVYLNITNPLQGGTHDISKEQLRKFVEYVAEDEDYGIDNYGYGSTVDSVTDSVFGKSDFEMLMDVNVSCIGDMSAAIELFNKANGTDYDGIITPMETVVFYPEQIKSVDNTKPTADPDIRYSLTEYTAEEKKAHNDAVRDYFGKTYMWAETGYLLLDGTKLDMSGKHEGAPGGYRTVDHRDIVDALGSDYGDGSYSGSLVQFMSEGNIRIIPEMGGINLSVKPTEAQEKALAQYVQMHRGEVVLDIDDANGYTVASVEYPMGTRSSKVLGDIRAYFENGTKPETSNPYSLTKKGATPKTYGNYNVYGKDIALAPVQDTVQESVQDVAPVQEKPMTADDMISAIQDKEFELQGYDRNAVPYAPATAEEAEQMGSDAFKRIRDTDAPPEVEAPYYGEQRQERADDPFLNRDWDERTTKAFTTDNPDAKPFFKEAAERLAEDYAYTVPAERGFSDEAYYNSNGEKGFYGWSRMAADDIHTLMDVYGLSYAQITDGLDAIINDTPKVNNKPAKTIEFILNNRLLKGYEMWHTKEYVPPHQGYIEWLNEQKHATEYADAFNSITDADAPISEEIAPMADTLTVEDVMPIAEDIAPMPKTAERYEAIKPKPQKEPKMARATPAEQARADILTEEPTTGKKKSGLWAWAKNNLLDKGMVFEDLSLKKGNRKLQARWHAIRNADIKAQRLIGKGNESVKSLNSIREAVERTGNTKQFYEYLYHKHNVDRMTLADRYENVPNKAVFGDAVTAQESQGVIAELNRKYPDFKQHAQDVYDYMTYLRQMLVDGGVISNETAKLWQEMYPHYVPIRRLGDDGLNINVPLDTGRTGVNAPIKKAKGGNRDILPLFDTMGQRTIQTFKAIAKNRFGTELKNTLGTTIESGVMGVDEAIDSIDTQDGLLQEGKNGKKPTFTVFENGEKVTFEITEEMYDALKPASEAMAYTNKVANTASNIFRGLTTEYNPTFLITNPIKDVQDVLINSQHPGRTYLAMPKAVWQMATNGHWYQEYLDNGGENNTYFDKQTNTFEKEKSGISKVLGLPLEGISRANNFIEMMPRLAEYIASREAERDVDVSMLDAARVTTNFAAGGDLTKMLNRNGATFLNASVQGAVQQVRNIREAKANGAKGVLSLVAKFAVAGFSAMVLNRLLWDDDDEYEELSDYVKQNYYIVGKFGDGKFVRIPKGRTVAVIQNAFEQLGNTFNGDEADWLAVGELAMSNLAPNNPLENNILAPIMQVANNKTWYGEDLVPTRLQDLPAAEQYDESTDSISKWLGEKLNYSPYKINYLLNQYTGGVGDTILPMLTPEAESGDNSIAGNMLAPFKDKFTTDAVMNNQNVGDFYDTVDKLAVNANGSKATDEDVLKYKYMNSVNADLSDLYKRKREVQNSDLPDDEKYSQVRRIQAQIDRMAETALNSYDSVAISGVYATVGDRHYRWYEPGEDSNAEPGWQKISGEQLKKQNEVTSALGIDPEEYWENKEEYDYAYKNPDKYAVAKAVGGYSAYRGYSSDLYDIKADKDSSGKSISGSRKEKVLDYINGLDIDYGERIILFKSEYTADDTYNRDIVEYLDSRDDISWDEMKTILEELDFTVYDDGRITW